MVDAEEFEVGEGFGRRLGVEELSRRSGVPERTLQRWHDSGALEAAEGTPGGARRYEPVAVDRARLMLVLRANGISLVSSGAISRGFYRG